MSPNATQHISWDRFARHFLEMVVAMVLGMVVLGMVTRLLLSQLGQATLLDQTELRVFLMAVNMTIGMTILMRYRGHGWISVSEMALAMFVPFLVVLIPFWLGGLSSGAVMMGGHLLMLPFMLVIMLRRRDEYCRDHQHHQAYDQLAPADRPRPEN